MVSVHTENGAMSRLLWATVFLCSASSLAMAQSGSDIKSGLNGEGGSLFGANVNVVNGTSANGTPKQLLPGSSMTNGAGGAAMTPGIAGNYGSTIKTPVLIINGKSTTPGSATQ
jgi:hypothetical protein